MGREARRTGRGFLIVAGVALVGIALAWFVIRNHDALRSFVGMDSTLGWVTHGAALLILLGGTALLARGIFGRAHADAAD